MSWHIKMCALLLRWKIFVLLMTVQYCIVAGVDRWGAYSLAQNNVNGFVKTSSYGTLNSYSVSVASSSGDKALLLVNGDYYREGSAADKRVLQFKLNANNQPFGGNLPFSDLQNMDAREFQPYSFFYLDTPATTSTTYMANVQGAGKLSAKLQTRRLDAVVFPTSFSPKTTTATSLVAVVGAGNNYYPWSSDLTVTITTATDRVLLLMSLPFAVAGDGRGHGAFTFYRGGAAGIPAATNLIVQTAGAVDPQVRRHVTGAYVDVPGVGTHVYAGMARKLTTPAGASNRQPDRGAVQPDRPPHLRCADRRRPRLPRVVQLPDHHHAKRDRGVPPARTPHTSALFQN